MVMLLVDDASILRLPADDTGLSGSLLTSSKAFCRHLCAASLQTEKSIYPLLDLVLNELPKWWWCAGMLFGESRR